MNETVEEEWVEETTPFERVYELIRRAYDPVSAAEIADRARVSPTTARKHLRTLESAGEVTTSQDGQTTRYRRSETAIVTEHAQSLLEERTPEEISSGIADMKAQIQEWREEYGVDSPEEFARALDVDDVDSDHGALLREWQTTRRNLALAQATLAIGEASQTGHLTGTDADDDGDGGTSLVV
ncbi:winged helix-turn-helix domain-containing protein [Haloarcula marina]|uniref:winged helix-turn-helix domain-containing protein n=1 Tax=Haloarcula marina TaxID=2961574 RepID=UPI0032AF5992